MRTVDGVTVQDVLAGGASIGAENRTATASNLTIKKAYFEGKPVGKTNLTVKYSDGSTEAFVLGVAKKSAIDYRYWASFQTDTPYNISAGYSSSDYQNRNYTDFWFGGTGVSISGRSLEGYDIFRTTKNGYADSGTSNFRTELRERHASGSTNNWNPNGYH